jgi:hypothetical protein
MGRRLADRVVRRRRGSASRRGTLSAVCEGEFALEVGVLIAQSLVLGAKCLDALAQRGLRCALPSRNTVGLSRYSIAQALDLASECGLGVEPLA